MAPPPAPSSSPKHGSYPYSLTNVNGTLFFTADDSVHGDELWKSNGTAAGTVLVKDINPGSRARIQLPDERQRHAVFLRQRRRARLWTVEEQWHGRRHRPRQRHQPRTRLVSSRPDEHQRHAVFRADDGVHGIELWKSNGAAAGTVMVKDINPGKRRLVSGRPDKRQRHAVL